MGETIKTDTILTGSNNAVHSMLADIPGGVELDMTGITTEYDSNAGYIPDGTPIWNDNGAYKPLQEADLVANGPSVVGFLFQAVHKDRAYASVAIRGVVVEDKLPFAIDAALKAAVPGISFV
jgi:hypothetical protein